MSLGQFLLVYLPAPRPGNQVTAGDGQFKQINSRRPERLPRPRCAQMPVRERHTITIAGRV